MAKVGVIGAGSWGIALAKLLRTNGNEVTVWSIVEEEVAMLRREHEHIDKLPGVKLPEDVLFTTDLKEAIVGKEFLILAVPSVFTRSTAKSMAGYVTEGQIITSQEIHLLTRKYPTLYLVCLMIALSEPEPPEPISIGGR